jgi:hypothetical protein
VSAMTAADDLLVTAEGYERLCSEPEMLRTERRRVMSERLREARADGDVEDNPRALGGPRGASPARAADCGARGTAGGRADRRTEPRREGRHRQLRPAARPRDDPAGGVRVGRRDRSGHRPRTGVNRRAGGRAPLGAGAGDTVTTGRAPLGGGQHRRSGASGEGGRMVRGAFAATHTSRGPSQLQRSPTA